MKIINNEPISESNIIVDTTSFKKGDLIVPSDGPRWSFYWRDGAILDNRYVYHIANSAEKSYFLKWIYNGYKLMGAVDSYDYYIKNFNVYVINYKEM